MYTSVSIAVADNTNCCITYTDLQRVFFSIVVMILFATQFKELMIQSY